MTAILRAESFEIVKNVYKTANINTFDFSTVKRALVEYIRQEFAETFNDFTESSEVIMLISAFAYISEIFSYRQDVGFNENFIQTAQLKNNIIRLAEQMFYSPKRNTAGTGLIKITSISVNEDVFTSSGINLRGLVVLWNDKNNNQWKEHFYLILNKVLQQSIGNVSINERTTYNGTIFESYQLNNTTTTNGTFSITASAGGLAYNLEMVPFVFTVDGLEERTPGLGQSINICYLNDGLGDGSQYTGFFFLTKQGNLSKTELTLENQPMNVVVNLNSNGINQEDVWVIEQPGSAPIVWDTIEKFSDVVDIQNKKTVLLRTLDNDAVELLFGDGTTREIPNGFFDVWYRTSSMGSRTISAKSIVNKKLAVSYLTSTGSISTAAFTLSLADSLSNGSDSENIDAIRSNAINLYPTLQRMVNGRDITNHFASQSDILACKAINKTFAGDSQYLSLNESSGTLTQYTKNIKCTCYLEDTHHLTTYYGIDAKTLIVNYIEPLLKTTEVITELEFQEQLNPKRPAFLIGNEYDSILKQFGVVSTTFPTPPYPIFPQAFYKNPNNDFWISESRIKNSNTGIIQTQPTDIIVVDKTFEDNRINWKVYVYGKKLTILTTDVKFDTNFNKFERVVLHEANKNVQRDSIIGYNVTLNRSGTYYNDDVLSVVNRIPVEFNDSDVDGYPDVFSPTGNTTGALFDATYTLTSYQESPHWYIDLPFNVIPSLDDIISISSNTTYAYDGDPNTPTNRIKLTNATSGTYNIKIRDRVFFLNSGGELTLMTGTYNDIVNTYSFNMSNGTMKSGLGRSDLIATYYRNANNSTIINPYSSNVIEVYIVTKGYRDAITEWVAQNKSYNQPSLPSSLYLQQTYAKVLKNKMISDVIIVKHALPKMIFNGQVPVFLKVTKRNNSISDYELKIKILEVVNDFFETKSLWLGEAVDFSLVISHIVYGLSHIINGIFAVDVNGKNITQISSYENDFVVVDINSNNIIIDL